MYYQIYLKYLRYRIKYIKTIDDIIKINPMNLFRAFSEDGIPKCQYVALSTTDKMTKNVIEFEEKWSKWLGVKYSVFTNSGSSENLLSLALLKIEFQEGGEVIVPPLTWVSDISSVIRGNIKYPFAIIWYQFLII